MNAETYFLLGALEPCWLWWLILSALAFILGALLGCFLCSNRKRLKELEEENRGLKAKITDVEKDYASLKYQYEEDEAKIKNLKMKLSSCEADKAVLNTKLGRLQNAEGEGQEKMGATTTPGTGDMAFASIFTEDNLQVVEGIGPKIEEVLKEAQVTTWKILSGKSEEQLRTILTDYNPNYRIHNPKSWPQQALLASQSKWDELIEYQKFLDGGKEDQGDFDTPSKVEKMAMKIWGFSNNPENLKIIEGIGPKIEGLLKDAGIQHWQQLADTPVSRLKEILDAAGGNYDLAVPDTWPRQAAMAAAGDWGALSAYQEELKGGRES
jgi:predicted flap endonuclease-1-like 5' DNA nuclease